MSLLARVSRLLTERGIDHAVIGAAALAAHGVARATADLDLLTVDVDTLDESLWADLRSGEVEVAVRRGDASDPLAGVVRVASKGEPSVDVIVGKLGWQREVLRRARTARFSDAEVRVVAPADLVLLKLYAGGPQDAWDIDQLLDVDAGIAADVEAGLDALPPECAALWHRIRAQRGGG